jgi:hypothetical protein
VPPASIPGDPRGGEEAKTVTQMVASGAISPRPPPDGGVRPVRVPKRSKKILKRQDCWSPLVPQLSMHQDVPCVPRGPEPQDRGGPGSFEVSSPGALTPQARPAVQGGPSGEMAEGPPAGLGVTSTVREPRASSPSQEAALGGLRLRGALRFRGARRVAGSQLHPRLPCDTRRRPWLCSLCSRAPLSVTQSDNIQKSPHTSTKAPPHPAPSGDPETHRTGDPGQAELPGVRP